MAKSDSPKRFVLTCKSCGHKNEFDQPYPYHAGFSDQGFLYNEAGNATLVWSAYDPFFRKHFEKMQLWPPSESMQADFEKILPLSPKGDRWSFSTPARCMKCKAEISGPMKQQIYYLIYPDSIDLTGPGPKELWLEFYAGHAS